jgi:CubicO group peptidase (beta-lactamase class C family)
VEKKIIALFIVIVVTAGIIFSTLYLLNQGEQPESIDVKIQSLMEEGNIPSLAAGIIINDNMIWSQGYGQQSDIDTVYMVGSVTKMFTATAIMQLVENGKLDLDADINTYIPFSVRNPKSPNTPISIRMLLTHQSGISKDVTSEILWDYDTEMLTWANNTLEANITLWENRPTLREFLEGSLNPSGQYYVPENWASPLGLT